MITWKSNSLPIREKTHPIPLLDNHPRDVTHRSMKILIPILTLTALLSPLMQAQERERAGRPQLKDDRKVKTEQLDWDSIKKRIEGAVARGDMTRAQADQKYLETKKKLAPPALQRETRSSPRRPIANQDQSNALKKLLSELLAQNKIERDDARRIAQAAYASFPRAQNRPLRDPQHRATEELRDTLKAAKRELAMLREAREQLSDQHHDQKHHDAEHHDAEHHDAEHHDAEHHERREHMERDQAARREEMNREGARAGLEKDRTRAQAEVAEQVREQREKAEKMRQEAERRLREISEQR